MLEKSMRAQAPEQQEPSIVSDSGPESPKSATRSPQSKYSKGRGRKVSEKAQGPRPRECLRQQRVIKAALSIREQQYIQEACERHCPL